ncbi:50S ribosomal protein L10 [Candidatus Woesearchaeota archaeon]|nr:50S ribosomal protein L10 [Candidatus Woesearchaeota archaeon]
MAHISEFKKKTVDDVVKLSKEYPIIGVVNMENLPAPQLQAMRAELRGKVGLFMTKKTLMKVALEKIKNDKKGIEALEEHFDGMPALIFTKDSPFKLSRILRKSRTPAPAKAGQIAPSDIVVPKGPTPFAPGPIISELSSAGLKVGVESGKVAVKEDTVVAKKGEKITGKVAEVLTRLGIKPMEVGLGLMAAYENGTIYQKEILDVDEQHYINNVNLAALQSFNLAFNITYITKDNAKLLIGKAFTDAKALGISQNIIDSGIIDELLAKAERSMLSLKAVANIETIPPKEVKEEKAEAAEKPAEKKEEIKPEIKEEKKSAKEPIQEIKKEEPVKEERQEEKESEIDEKEAEIEEELKKAKEEDEQKKVEDLAKELLKKGTLRK